MPDEQTLLIPDYKGNNFFNTLGNLKLDPRAGLLFIDFASGNILRIAITADVIAGEEAERLYPGFERVIKALVQSAVRALCALPIQYALQEYWPYLPPADAESSAP